MFIILVLKRFRSDLELKKIEIKSNRNYFLNTEHTCSFKLSSLFRFSILSKAKHSKKSNRNFLTRKFLLNEKYTEHQAFLSWFLLNLKLLFKKVLRFAFSLLNN